MKQNFQGNRRFKKLLSTWRYLYDTIYTFQGDERLEPVPSQVWHVLKHNLYCATNVSGHGCEDLKDWYKHTWLLYLAVCLCLHSLVEILYQLHPLYPRSDISWVSAPIYSTPTHDLWINGIRRYSLYVVAIMCWERWLVLETIIGAWIFEGASAITLSN